MATLVTGLFFISGLVALAYEIVWVRALGLVVGNSLWAAVAVVAAYMGGMALGNAIVAKVARRVRYHLRLYAAAEAVAAGAALVTAPCLGLLQRIAAHLGPQPLAGWGLALAARFAIAWAFLLVPTVAMGTTLPLLVARVGRGHAAAWRVGRLYAANTFGAVAGVVVAGFFALPAIGEHGTLALAATLGLAVAAVAWVAEPALPPAERTAPTIAPSSHPGVWLLYPAVFGFVALACELVWTRVLILYLGSRVYAFALILAVYLLGIAAGSVVARAASGRPRRALMVSQLLVGLTLGLQVFVLVHFGDLLGAFAGRFRLAGFGALQLALAAAVALATLPPAIGFGASFPLAVAAHPGGGDVETRTGAVGATNTCGAIVGSVLGPLVLVPAVGTQNLILGLGVLAATAAALLAEGRRWRGAAIGLGAALLVEAALLPRGAVLRPAAGGHGDAIEVLRESASATVVVRRTVDQAGPTRLLELNGVNVAGTSPELRAIQRLQGHLPLLLDRHPDSVLHIGFGSGGTAWAVAQHGVRRIVIAEISPEVLGVSDSVFREVNHGVLHDPRVEVIENDGRNFLLASKERFDVLLSDSIHPVYAGNSTLYTREYFEMCRSHLRPGGVVSMWLPMYSLTQRSYLTIVRAFWEVFPGASIWYDPVVANEFTVVTGSADPGPVRVRWEALSDPRLRPTLAEAGVSDAASLAGMLLLAPREVAALVDGVMPHVDDFPEVEYDSGRTLDRDRSWLRNFYMLFATRTRTNPFAALPADWATVARARDAVVSAQLRAVRARLDNR